MELKEVLDDRIIDLNVDAKNKDEAIRHLAQKLKDADYIGDVDETGRSSQELQELCLY